MTAPKSESSELDEWIETELDRYPDLDCARAETYRDRWREGFLHAIEVAWKFRSEHDRHMTAGELIQHLEEYSGAKP